MRLKPFFLTVTEAISILGVFVLPSILLGGLLTFFFMRGRIQRMEEQYHRQLTGMSRLARKAQLRLKARERE